MMVANFSRLKYWFLGLQSASADLFDWELKLAKQKGCNIVYVCTEQIKVKGNLGFLMNYIYARYVPILLHFRGWYRKVFDMR